MFRTFKRLAAARPRGSAAAERWTEGELRTLDPAWRPVLPALPSPRPPDPGVVMNLLEASLPHVTAGYAQRSRAICAAQRRCGLHPVVVTRLGFPASRGIAHEPLEWVDGVPCHRLSIPGLRHYTAVPRDEQLELNARLAAELAEDLRPALLWAGTPHLNGLVGLALRDRLGVPLVYDVRGFRDLTWRTEHGSANARPDDYARRLRDAEARCMRDADAVVTLSETMRAEVVDRGADPRRVWVLPHAVDPDLSPAQEAALAAAATLRRRFRTEGRVVVGHASTLRAYEGVDILLRAVAAARAGRDDIACVVVGDGPARADLERLADDLRLGDAALFTGRVDSSEMSAHYAACDVLAVPRTGAPVCRRVTPLKLVEAMAASRCVVASALAPIEEALGDAGRLVPADDVDALAAALVELAGDPVERERLGSRARDRAARYSTAALDDALGTLGGALGIAAAVSAAEEPV